MSAHPVFERGVLGAALVLGSGSLGCGSGIDTPSEGQANTPANAFSTPSTNNPAAAPTNTPSTTTPVQTTPETQPTPVRATPSSPAPTQSWQPPAVVDPASPVGQHGQLRVQGTALVDQSGAAVQLKGISSMWLNWEDRY